MSEQLHTCDCGSIAYKRDGSGWFCRECEIAVRCAQEWIDRMIRRLRDEAGQFERGKRRAAYQRNYAASHREEIRDYQRRYQRQRRHLCRPRRREWRG